MKWTSIKHLPDCNESVIICYNLGSEKAPFYRYAIGQLLESKKKFMYLDGTVDVHKVVAWMDFPKYNNDIND